MSSTLIGTILLLVPLTLLVVMVLVLRQRMQIGRFAWTLQAAHWAVVIHLFSGRYMPWYWIGETSRLAFAIIAVLVVVFCYRRQLHQDWFPVGWFWNSVAFAFLLGCVVWGDMWLGATADAHIDIDSPIKGTPYYVVQGGNNRLTNHHHRDPVQRHAVDMVVIGDGGKRASSFYPSELSGYYSFNFPLNAPCAGVVKAVFNRLDDLQPGHMDAQNIAGNHVLIACDKFFVLLAHLKKEPNPLLKIGDNVELGQLVGHIGNTGNSTEPHLHMHVVIGANETDAAYPLSGVGVPFTINNRKMTRGKFD